MMIYMIYNKNTRERWVCTNNKKTLREFGQYLINGIPEEKLKDFKLAYGRTEEPDVTVMSFADYCNESGLKRQTFEEKMELDNNKRVSKREASNGNQGRR